MILDGDYFCISHRIFKKTTSMLRSVFPEADGFQISRGGVGFPCDLDLLNFGFLPQVLLGSKLEEYM